MGLHGLTVDHLLEAEVVLASGEVVRAGPAEHPDLFWAVRGGGGNFGVVTSFVFRLHPQREVVGGLIAHPLSAAPDLLRFHREATADVPDELTAFAGLAHAPDEAASPVAALLVCHAGSRERAARDLEPLLAWGSPVMSEVGPMAFPVLNAMFDDEFPRGALNYWRSTFRPRPGRRPDRRHHRPLRALPVGAEPGRAGALPRRGHARAALGDRRPASPRGLQPVHRLGWTDPADTEANVRWTRETYAAVEPHRADGRWLNYYDGDEGAAALEEAWGANASRLAEVKRRYDPDNVLHLNQNIAPAPVGA